VVSHRQQPPLAIHPRLSPRLAAFVVLTHLIAAAAVGALPGLWSLLLIPVAASLAYQIAVHCLRRAPWSIRSLVWEADGTWHIPLVSGAEIQARLSPSTFVSVPLVVLCLRSGRLRLRRWSFPLFSDALDPDLLRRLRQRLRIEGTGREVDAAPA
jgi:toxin CptA